MPRQGGELFCYVLPEENLKPELERISPGVYFEAHSLKVMPHAESPPYIADLRREFRERSCAGDANTPMPGEIDGRIPHGDAAQNILAHLLQSSLHIMKNILLCSSNPILVKSLYGVLRSEGYAVDIVEHPALAVQQVMNGACDMMVVDSEPFGLSAEDAVQIIRSVRPAMPVLYVGSSGGCASERTVETPLDLEEFKRTVHSIAV